MSTVGSPFSVRDVLITHAALIIWYHGVIINFGWFLECYHSRSSSSALIDERVPVLFERIARPAVVLYSGVSTRCGLENGNTVKYENSKKCIFTSK